MTLVSRILGALLNVQAITAGEAAGLKLGAYGVDPEFRLGTYERPMQVAIAASLSAGDVFYDVGANVGFFSLIAARKVGPQGCVYAFEPVPSNVSVITRCAQLNNFDTITVFQEAVGVATGRAELLLAHHIGGATLASAGAPPDTRGCIEVDVVSLDDAIAGRGLRPPSLVKIDVEGAEIDVLRGMAQTLRLHRPAVIYEVDDATSAGLRQKAEAIAKFLNAAGYTITALPPSYPNLGWRVEHLLAVPCA